MKNSLDIVWVAVTIALKDPETAINNSKCQPMKTYSLLIIATLAGVGLPSCLLGQTWNKTTAPNASWFSIGMSGDGKRMVACAPETLNLYVSTDSGNSWQSGPRIPDVLAEAVSSADGSEWFGMDSDNRMFISANPGVSWSELNRFAADGFGLSADGSVLVVNSGASIMFSTNTGTSWNTVSAPFGILQVAANATKWVLTDWMQQRALYCSTNWGATWTTNALPSTNRLEFAISADGNEMVAAESVTTGIGSYQTYAPGAIYLSTNSGASWMLTTAPSNCWTAVACSARGNRLVAIAYPLSAPYSAYTGGIFTSGDRGCTWVSNNVPATVWAAVSCSSDGCRMAAAASGGGIYVFQFPPEPKLESSLTSNNIVLSWTLPSTNLVLQQCSDLTTAAWSNLTNIPVLNYVTLQNEVGLPAPTGSAFFRLKSP